MYHYQFFEHTDLRSIFYPCSRPRRKTKTLMKKDKYPLAGGLISTDPTRPNSASLVAGRDMYSSMNGYMPNGYHYDTSMYSQSPYAPSHMSSSPTSIYSRYDMSSMYGPSSTTASAMSSYMNSSYAMSMYGSGGAGSPYSGMGQPMSPDDPEGSGGGGVPHPNHSPGSVKSEAGASGPPTGSSTVSMSSGSPVGSSMVPGVPGGPVPPPAGSGGPLPPVKREPTVPSPAGSAGPPPGTLPPSRPQDLNSMISMYLPGDAAAAAAGDPNAQSRINSLSQQMYASGHYSALMCGPPHASHSPDPMSLPPSSAYPV